jgi:hypothetical protein
MHVETPVGESEGKSPLSQGWRKSSYSMSNGHCVEIAFFATEGRIGIRDSKAISTGGSVLRFETRAWNTFLDELRIYPPF